MQRLLLALLVLLLGTTPVHAVTLRWAAQNDILTFDPHSQNHGTTNNVGSSRVDLQACKLEYSIVSPK